VLKKRDQQREEDETMFGVFEAETARVHVDLG